MVLPENERSKEMINLILQDYVDKIFAFALKRTMDRHEAEDLSQDIVYEVLRSASSLKDPKALNGWLWAIAKNTWKRWVYKRTTHPITSYEDLNYVITDTHESPEDTAAIKEETQLLRRELALLSQIQRSVTIMHYIEDKNCKEISEALNISEAMVRQHLFKARKNLKEGIDMIREYGEKSYNPKNLNIGFWGEGNAPYFKMLERKLPKNILLSAYQKPISIEEMSMDIGIPRPYLEDELKILVDADVMAQSKAGLYQTKFIIVLKDLQEQIDALLAEKSITFTARLLESFNKNEQEIRNIGFIGSDFKWEKLLWTLIPLSLFSALSELQSEALPEQPLLKTGVHGWVNARERLGEPWDFGVCSHDDSESNLGYWSCTFHISPKRTSTVYGPNDDELRLLSTLFHNARDLTQFDEKELETAAILINQGFIKKENQTYTLNCIAFDRDQHLKRIALDKSDRAFIYDELRALLHMITALLDSAVPANLKDQTTPHAFLSLLYIASHVMRRLNDQAVLNIAPDEEKNTRAFCLFKGCTGNIPD
jgi:RNA polymerase sigma factor (sigma-70 family)